MSAPDYYPVDRKNAAPIACTDMAFVTSRPPDHPSRNRIVAVCGLFETQGADKDAHNQDSEADACSPAKDGFMLSDLYLFFHLFRPARESRDPRPEHANTFQANTP